MERYILSIDQGTTATKSLLVDSRGSVLATASRPLGPIYPQPGWVEMDPAAIWRSVLDSCAEALARGSVEPRQIEAIGIANQGETCLAWDSVTGEPLCNAISWQCSRTEACCKALAESVGQEMIRAKTGLVLDPYFSATKMQWVLENVPAAREALQSGRLMMGNLDSWLIWRMTGGQRFVTDYSTASRTMLFNVHHLDWDEELLSLFGIPRWALPDPCASSTLLGESEPAGFLGLQAPITGSAVDQPASLFGHGCVHCGECKVTYGTGAFLLMNIGSEFALSEHGLLTSLAATAEGEAAQYYLDGGVYCAGAAVQWLQGNLGVIESAEETGQLAEAVEDSGGVIFVPALVGLAAPYWDRQARGAFLGLTQATTRAHIIRAVLESVAFRVHQVVRAMESDSCQRIETLRVDGGVARNDFLMQFQADLLGIPLERHRLGEVTALGAARLAGLATGFWRRDQSRAQEYDVFAPTGDNRSALEAFARWEQALELVRAFR